MNPISTAINGKRILGRHDTVLFYCEETGEYRVGWIHWHDARDPHFIESATNSRMRPEPTHWKRLPDT